MTQERKKVKELIEEGLSIISNMNINYQSIAGKNTLNLKRVVKELFPLIKYEYNTISKILSDAEEGLITNRFINAYRFGDIRTSLKILRDKYEKSKKIFISHSSKDKIIVEIFVDHVLQLGIGLDSKDIFCTSIEDMDIENGEDIRSHIKNNILSSDFSLLMISCNYKKSEICLNEMGAVWINNNNIRYYLLPQTHFGEIGWLCDTNKADNLLNSIALDKMYREIISYYKLEDRFDSWSRHRETFISNVERLSLPSM